MIILIDLWFIYNIYTYIYIEYIYIYIIIYIHIMIHYIYIYIIICDIWISLIQMLQSTEQWTVPPKNIDPRTRSAGWVPRTRILRGRSALRTHTPGRSGSTRWVHRTAMRWGWSWIILELVADPCSTYVRSQHKHANQVCDDIYI